MKIPIHIRTLAGAAMLTVTGALFAQGVIKQTTSVLGQALEPGMVDCDAMDRSIVAVNGATLIRTRSGITASFSMPTPQSSAYCYPPTNPFQTVAPVPGVPEDFI